jgi:hypothetical protein
LLFCQHRRTAVAEEYFKVCYFSVMVLHSKVLLFESDFQFQYFYAGFHTMSCKYFLAF